MQNFTLGESYTKINELLNVRRDGIKVIKWENNHWVRLKSEYTKY